MKCNIFCNTYCVTLKATFLSYKLHNYYLISFDIIFIYNFFCHYFLFHLRSYRIKNELFLQIIYCLIKV